MEQHEIDQLYHLLRVVEVTSREEQDQALGDVIYGLTNHLLGGGDYLALLRYLGYYGSHFLLEPTYKALFEKGWVPTRLVEFGAGNGWLSLGLAIRFGITKRLTVDKRPWTMIDVIADLETPDGILEVQNKMQEGDIIVMSDFLHCINNTNGLLEAFSKHRIMALEYMPDDPYMRESYSKQLEHFGATALEPAPFLAMLSCLGRHIDIIDLDSYKLVLIG